MSIAEVRSWNTGTFGTAAGAASARAADIDSSMTTADEAVGAADEWAGPSGDAARRGFHTALEQSRELRNLLLCIADDAADADREVGSARNHLLELVNSCRPDVVGDDGAVIDPDGNPVPDATARVRAALAEVYRQDGLFAAVLAETAQALRLAVTDPARVPAPNGATTSAAAVIAQLRDMSIGERQDYFARLSPAEQRVLLSADPVTIGNTDGVPFGLRIAANDVNIRNARDAELRKQPAKRDQALIDRYTAMVDTPIEEPNLRDHRAHNDNTTERQFVAFDPRGQGRWIEQIGRITPAAKGVGVYVPGTGTTLAGSDRNHESARNLARQSGSAVFVYVNGDLPNNVFPDKNDWFPQATDGAYARAMSPGLVDFGRALDHEIDHAAPGLKTTFIGHSYGGLVVGHAEELGLRADRVVYASSPATGLVHSQPWTNPAADVKRYSVTAPGDYIQDVQAMGYFDGQDPDHHAKITRMDSGYYSDGRLVEGTGGHGGYWNDPGSDAFKNMARVIGGDDPTPYVHRKADTHPGQAFDRMTELLEQAPRRAREAVSEAWDLPNLLRLGYR
ncbi:alpha/beta hydrolase [Jongsikchunia kroppenstedtii]|uniref:alpha/beta hydrolase n=1 Tax=Jongsikchunia kroppenstedtii TaxID=1121721 RepID=UPI0003A648C9|nr:alpha/beta hydrolase [Jongsikchunia kroppenstedtii]